METKKCTKCKEEKEIILFGYRDKKSKTLKSHCKKCISERKSKWVIDNRERITESKRKWKINKKKTDPIYKLDENTRKIILSAFKRGVNQSNKKAKAEKILGCTINEFLNYIEYKFTEGMTFENHGIKGWHLDHIIPTYFAKTEEELLKLNHYTNFQPLWAEDNYKKSNSI